MTTIVLSMFLKSSSFLVVHRSRSPSTFPRHRLSHQLSQSSAISAIKDNNDDVYFNSQITVPLTVDKLDDIMVNLNNNHNTNNDAKSLYDIDIQPLKHTLINYPIPNELPIPFKHNKDETTEDDNVEESSSTIIDATITTNSDDPSPPPTSSTSAAMATVSFSPSFDLKSTSVIVTTRCKVLTSASPGQPALLSLATTCSKDVTSSQGYTTKVRRYMARNASALALNTHTHTHSYIHIHTRAHTHTLDVKRRPNNSCILNGPNRRALPCGRLRAVLSLRFSVGGRLRSLLRRGGGEK